MISLSLADKNTYFLCLGEMNKLYIIKKTQSPNSQVEIEHDSVSSSTTLVVDELATSH